MYNTCFVGLDKISHFLLDIMCYIKYFTRSNIIIKNFIGLLLAVPSVTELAID